VRVFACDHCDQVVFFDNDTCLRCSSPLGYIAARADIVSLTEVAPGRLVDLSGAPRAWQRCATAAITGCNWLVPYGSDGMCESCSLTRTRPADDDQVGLAEFFQAETAKRRLLFQLAQLGLPVDKRDDEAEKGLAFDLLSSETTKVITGHDNGVVTLDLAEADDEHRERLRHELDEPYRTLLGHFRHEIGHYYWPILVTDPDVLDACRALFGDDREDYAQAVKRYYAEAAVEGQLWPQTHISVYATMHPYEDWAETFAHYLHILDTLQTADCFGLGDGPSGTGDATRPDGARTFGEVIDRWLGLTRALNEVNRSMGKEDLYPFVIAPPVVRKLAFVDRTVRRWQKAHGMTFA